MSAPIEFLLNGESVLLTGVAPGETLLDWLRGERGLTGCKEGCAEGDCGACTVVVAELDAMEPGRLRWRSLNACIQLLPMLHGKALFTVEYLRRDGQLHPIQQALVDHHASQCGFCTPGFVMSLFALFRETPRPARDDIQRALSGNLCRCTGYRPILDAARSIEAGALPPIDEQSWIAALRAIGRPAGLAWRSLCGEAVWHAPASLDELAALYADHPSALLVAGNTDVGLWINKQLQDPACFIGLDGVEELQRIGQHDGMLRIGAGVRLDDAFAALTRRFPRLRPFFDRFSSQPVRNAGTLAGNIANASPIGDGPPLLLALDARLVLNRAGRRRELPLAAFFLGYRKTALQAGEFIESVLIPEAPPTLELAAWKLSKREDQDISAVCAALALRRDEAGVVREARFAFGGMAAIPKRAAAAEAAVLGQPWDGRSLEAARAALARDFTPLDDLRASAEYRLHAAQNLLTRFWFQSLGSGHALVLDDLETVS